MIESDFQDVGGKGGNGVTWAEEETEAGAEEKSCQPGCHECEDRITSCWWSTRNSCIPSTVVNSHVEFLVLWDVARTTDVALGIQVLARLVVQVSVGCMCAVPATTMGTPEHFLVIPCNGVWAPGTWSNGAPGWT